MSEKIQRYERNTYSELPIYCPMCGHGVITIEGNEPKVDPCRHTLFVATDEGFEFIAEGVVAQLASRGLIAERGNIGWTVSADEEEEIPSPDELTDDLEFPDSLKIATYIPAPSFFGSYIGFAPTVDGVTE